MSHCPYETLPGLAGRAVSCTGGGTPSVHVTPSLNPSPRGRDSAAEAAVRLQAQSLRSEGASIQRQSSARDRDSGCFMGLRKSILQLTGNKTVTIRSYADPSEKQQVCGIQFRKLLISSNLQNEHQQISVSPTPKTRLTSPNKHRPRHSFKMSGFVFFCLIRKKCTTWWQIYSKTANDDKLYLVLPRILHNLPMKKKMSMVPFSVFSWL